jgi:hypothetical protein
MESIVKLVKGRITGIVSYRGDGGKSRDRGK